MNTFDVILAIALGFAGIGWAIKIAECNRLEREYSRLQNDYLSEKERHAELMLLLFRPEDYERLKKEYEDGKKKKNRG